MRKEEMVMTLNNVLFTLEAVCAKGEDNWNALLASKQNIRRVIQALEEEEQNG